MIVLPVKATLALGALQAVYRSRLIDIRLPSLRARALRARSAKMLSFAERFPAIHLLFEDKSKLDFGPRRRADSKVSLGYRASILTVWSVVHRPFAMYRKLMSAA